MSVRRVAVISYHSSPLVEPGVGDAGGMSVYVRELATALATMGVATDIFTRATTDTQRVVELGPSVRVVCVEAGPRRPLDKDEAQGYIGNFATGIGAFALGRRIAYDVIHSHYWQSGLAAEALARSWRVPVVHSHHTLGRVKNATLAPGDPPEPQSRLDGEDAVIGAADVLVASTDDEFRQLTWLYGAAQDRLKTIHPGVDHDAF
ncbi:MAG: glycosyltransferase, partial [Actinomycetota bacterium]